MNNPKFSIVTVCKNCSNDLDITIQSVLKQKNVEYEYIIIDGNSDDGTGLIVKKYLNLITCFISEPDKGIYDAMNKGIRKSTGEYLIFLNAGDYFINNEILENVSNQIENQDIIIGKVCSENYYVKPRWFETIDKIYLFHKTPPHQACFIKRNIFLNTGLYNTSLKIRADYDFFIRAIITNKCKFKQLDMIISYFKPGGISQNKRYKNQMIEETNTIINRYFSKYEQITLKTQVIVKNLLRKIGCI